MGSNPTGPTGVSFSGKTVDFESALRGSIPRTPTSESTEGNAHAD